MEVDIYVAVQEIGIGGEVDAQLEEEDERVGGMKVGQEIESQNGNAVDSDIDSDADVDGKNIQGMSVTHHVLTPSLNLAQETYSLLHAHIYISLLGYFVPHYQLLIHLLHVYLRLCS